MGKNFKTTFKGRGRRSNVAWQISDDVLHKDGEPVADFRTVTGGRYAFTNGRMTIERHLSIESSLGTAHIVSTHQSRDGADRAMKLFTRVLEGIEEHSPDARIYIGNSFGWVLTHFLFGLFILSLGIWLLTGDGGGPLIRIVVASPLVLYGAWRAFVARPWNQDRLLVSAKQAIPALWAGPYRLVGRQGPTG